MNLSVLHQNITEQFANIRPAVDAAFLQTIKTVTKTKQAVNIKSFVKRLNIAFRLTPELSGIRVRVKADKRFGSAHEHDGRFYPALGGYCYEPEHKTKLANIRVIVHVHPESNRLPLSAEAWKYFHFRFLKTLSHELVHRAQFANGRKQESGFVFRPHTDIHRGQFIFFDQSYLGDIDEVEAFARDCVEEWHYRKYQTLTTKSLRQEFGCDSKIPSIKFYADTFRGDKEHPAVRRFLRKIGQWNRIIIPLADTLPNAPGYVQKDPAGVHVMTA